MSLITISKSIPDELKHKGDLQSILSKDGKVYSSGDDGKVKVIYEVIQ